MTEEERKKLLEAYKARGLAKLRLDKPMELITPKLKKAISIIKKPKK